MFRRRFLVSSLSLLGLKAVAAPPPHEQTRIEKLIQYIENQKGMKFIRNGSEYNCEEAGRFLRGKLDSMGDKVTTAREFIEHIGSRSSMSGKAYQVRFADGRIVPSAQFLHEELMRIEHRPG